MLKILSNFNKSRLNYLCQPFSTSSTRWQGGELTKKVEQDYAVRAVEKKPQRLPLVKNFFACKVDTELLAYPEALYETEHLANANKRKKEYEDFLATNIFENPNDVNNIRKLKEFGCFRNNSVLTTENFLSSREVESSILSYSTFLNNHQLVLKVVEEFGDPSQKLKYTPLLESGEFTAVPCIFEPKNVDSGKKTFFTNANFNYSTDGWTLNGEKSSVLISPDHKNSTMFLVIASVEVIDHIGDVKDGVGAFLVDGSLPGVTITGVEETVGYDEKVFNQVTVSFKDVALDKSSILDRENGYQVVQSVLNSSRLSKGVQAYGGVMKPLLKRLVKHCIDTKIQGISLKDVDTVKEQLGALTSHIYALESMIYMTAGLSDIYDKQDVEVESAIVQAYAENALTDFIVRPLHSVGANAVVKGAGFEKYIRDATQLVATGEQLDAVKQFIALASLNHAGQILRDVVMKDRNPLNHPAFIFSRIFNQTSIDFPKKKFNLEGFLHPSLDAASNYLESSLLRLAAAVEILLARHGPMVAQHSVELARISDAATLCYAMFAVLARASRAYCIGLRNADQEIHLAGYFCFDGANKVKVIAKDIDNGEYGTSEHTFKIVAEKLIETKDYHLEHPTTRNY